MRQSHNKKTETLLLALVVSFLFFTHDEREHAKGIAAGCFIAKSLKSGKSLKIGESLTEAFVAKK